MATILKEYPRLFSYPKGERTYYRVDLRHKDYLGEKKTKDFPSEADARTFRSEFLKTKNQDGFNALAQIQSPRLDKLDKQTALFGHTPEEAVTVACRLWLDEVSVKQSCLMSELLLLWQNDKETGRKKQRSRSMKTIKSYVKSFTDYFGNFRIKEVDEQKLDDYLKSKVNAVGNPIEPSTQRNHLRYLQGFFNWAIHKKFCTHNPANHWLKEIFVEKKPIRFYTVNECQEICRLILLPEHEPMLGYFALCLFGGIRPEEAEKLNWENHILWDTKEIHIPAHIAKPKKPRQFVMPSPLYDWLAMIKDRGVPLIPAKNKRKLRYKVIHKFTFKTIHDGLRHTFATYMRIKTPSIDLTRIMGNSQSILDNHYVGVISPADVNKFFELTPQYVNEHNPKEKIKRYKEKLAQKETEERLKLPAGAARKKVIEYLDKLHKNKVAVAG